MGSWFVIYHDGVAEYDADFKSLLRLRRRRSLRLRQRLLAKTAKGRESQKGEDRMEKENKAVGAGREEVQAMEERDARESFFVPVAYGLTEGIASPAMADAAMAKVEAATRALFLGDLPQEEAEALFNALTKQYDKGFWKALDVNWEKDPMEAVVDFQFTSSALALAYILQYLEKHPRVWMTEAFVKNLHRALLQASWYLLKGHGYDAARMIYRRALSMAYTDMYVLAERGLVMRAWADHWSCFSGFLLTMPELYPHEWYGDAKGMANEVLAMMQERPSFLRNRELRPGERYYIAYGSNMNKEQMERRCPDARCIWPAMVDGYRLEYGNKCSSGNYATLVPAEGSSVPALIWAVSEADKRRLDRYEGVALGCYEAKVLPFRSGPWRGAGLAYVMPEDFTPGEPSEEYLELVDDARVDLGFLPSRIPDFDDEGEVDGETDV